MPYRDGDEVETFRDVIVVDTRKPSEQTKSVKCRFTDGRERFVSRQWVPSYQQFPDDGGKFELEVSSFMVGLWAKNDSEPVQVVKIADVVCLRESRDSIDIPNPPKGTVRRPKALQVRLPSGEEAWCPGLGISPDSPVRADGDRGELWLAPWCAKLKNWHASPSGATNGPPARSQEARRDAWSDSPRVDSISDDLRGGVADDDDPLPF
jgi:hypothetical protein